MRNKQGITAFYMEMLVLILVFTGVILTLTRMFALSKEQSTQARVLTRGVRLAENAAELLAAAESPEAFLEMLNQDNAQESEDAIRAWYNADMTPGRQGDFCVAVTWEEQGGLAESEIAVYWQGGAEPVYTLHTAAYLGGGGG